MNAVRASARAVVPWWRAGGAPEPVAAYQPIGAASQAASYTNLANPGTYDGIPRNSPGWNSSGWTISSNQAIEIEITVEQTWTVIALVDNPQNNGRLWSARASTYQCIPFTAGDANYRNGTDILIVGGADNERRTFAIANDAAYRDGADVGAITLGSLSSGNCFLGNRPELDRPLGGFLQAVAIYDTTLTAPQVAAVSAAMADLT